MIPHTPNDWAHAVCTVLLTAASIWALTTTRRRR